jgi:hypothetical protein
MHQHGPARTFREMLTQEGQVMALAGCSGPTLDAEDIVYTLDGPYIPGTGMLLRRSWTHKIAVVDQMVEDEPPNHGRSRHGEKRCSRLEQRPRLRHNLP